MGWSQSDNRVKNRHDGSIDWGHPVRRRGSGNAIIVDPAWSGARRRFRVHPRSVSRLSIVQPGQKGLRSEEV
jgi:hypothetical protein